MSTANEFGQSATAPGDAPVWQPAVPEAEPAEGGAEAAGIEPGAESAPVRSAPTRTGRAKRAGSTSVLLIVSALIALGGVGFAVGRATSTGSGGTGDTSAAALNNGFPGGGANASGRPDFAGGANALTSATTVSGTVVSSTADSITIQLANGQQVTLSTGSSTAYHSQTSASGSDVAVGASVIVKTAATTGSAASPAASPAASAGTGTGGARNATDITITGN
jgi:hypothetical protein